MINFCSKQKNNLGFTLVETLIYVAIIGGISATFISYSLNISGAREKTYGAQEVHANARMALDVITQKIMLATSVNMASSTFGVSPGVLVLNMASSTKNPTIISLEPSSQALQIQEGLNAATSVTSNYVRVENLVFTNLSASSTKENIKINLAISAVTSTDVIYTNTQSLETAVSLRK